MLKKGQLLPIPEEYAGMIMPIQVCDAAKKLRLIVNGIPLNFYLPKPHKSVQYIGKCDRLLAGDLKSAFHHTLYTPKAAVMLCFRAPHPTISGKTILVAPASGMFGNSQAGYRFGKDYGVVGGPCGIWGFFYVDDFRIMVPDNKLHTKVVGKFVLWLHRITGMQLEWVKSA